MATSSKVQLTEQQGLQYSVPGLTNQAAATVSKMLQENHEQHHVFFNNSGFHNHIVHHHLTLFALGANVQILQQQYDHNKAYQLPAKSLTPAIISDFSYPLKLRARFGKAQHYHGFLVFFQSEIGKTSWQSVLHKYLFAGDELAEDLLVRLWGGLLHPLIHLGFGIEASQPAIIAEALAQAAVHDTSMTRLFRPLEIAVEEHRSEPSRHIADLLDEIHCNQELHNAPRWSDLNKLRDGVLARASSQLVTHAAQFHVTPADLEYKTAEMINAVAYYTGGAQRTGLEVKYDFFFIHCLNSSIFFTTFLKQDWLDEATKCRLLEWKVWMDLAMYASRKSPEIRLDLVRAYKPAKPSDWSAIFARVQRFLEDGHAAKLIRALANGQRVCAPFEDREEFRVKHDDFLQLAHMAIDSVEAGEPHWVRSAGFDEAWEAVPKAQL